ncbi:MAG: orotidine-5'-phosphate decarboxylase [Microgenomates group bacterium]
MFFNKLQKIVEKNQSLICVGLDSDIEKIPAKFSDQYSFNKDIIDNTFDLVCSYKLNTAFYEAIGYKGILSLKKTCDYLKEKYPEIPIIIDAKRGDIGNTNNGYLKFVFDYLGADAVTVNPYLGSEALEPFLSKKDKGIIVLCKTSNQGAFEFQDLKVKDKKGDWYLYEYVAYQVAKKWNKNKNCLLVVGATYPKELKKVREIVGDKMWILVPGVGAQGGDIKQVLQAGLNKKGQGLIINVSRNVIFDKDPRGQLKHLTSNI